MERIERVLKAPEDLSVLMKKTLILKMKMIVEMRMITALISKV